MYDVMRIVCRIGMLRCICYVEYVVYGVCRTTRGMCCGRRSMWCMVDTVRCVVFVCGVHCEQ